MAIVKTSTLSLAPPIGALIPVLKYSGYVIPRGWMEITPGETLTLPTKYVPASASGMAFAIPSTAYGSVFYPSDATVLTETVDSETRASFTLSIDNCPQFTAKVYRDSQTTYSGKKITGDKTNGYRTTDGTLDIAATSLKQIANSNRPYPYASSVNFDGTSKLQDGSGGYVIKVPQDTTLTNGADDSDLRHTHDVEVDHNHVWSYGSGNWNETVTIEQGTTVTTGSEANNNLEHVQTVINIDAEYKVLGATWLLRIF